MPNREPVRNPYKTSNTRSRQRVVSPSPLTTSVAVGSGSNRRKPVEFGVFNTHVFGAQNGPSRSLGDRINQHLLDPSRASATVQTRPNQPFVLLFIASRDMPSLFLDFVSR